MDMIQEQTSCICRSMWDRLALPAVCIRSVSMSARRSAISDSRLCFLLSLLLRAAWRLAAFSFRVCIWGSSADGMPEASGEGLHAKWWDEIPTNVSTFNTRIKHKSCSLFQIFAGLKNGMFGALLLLVAGFGGRLLLITVTAVISSWIDLQAWRHCSQHQFKVDGFIYWKRLTFGCTKLFVAL